MTAHDQAGALEVLQALRLAGFSEQDGITARTGLPRARITEILGAAESAGEAETLQFADLQGWVLTDTGRARAAALSAEEVEAAGARPALDVAIERFEEVNGPFVQEISHWQLRSTEGTEATSGTQSTRVDPDLLHRLTGFGTSMRSAVAELIRALPRFARYPDQYEAAVRAATADGGLGWVTGVGILSCHTVWAELHQDLLLTAGRERSAESGPSR